LVNFQLTNLTFNHYLRTQGKSKGRRSLLPTTTLRNHRSSTTTSLARLNAREVSFAHHQLRRKTTHHTIPPSLKREPGGSVLPLLPFVTRHHHNLRCKTTHHPLPARTRAGGSFAHHPLLPIHHHLSFARAPLLPITTHCSSPPLEHMVEGLCPPLPHVHSPPPTLYLTLSQDMEGHF